MCTSKDKYENNNSCLTESLCKLRLALAMEKSCISSERQFWKQVQPIVDSVRDEGDAAVSQWTSKFDRVDVEVVCCPIQVRLVFSESRKRFASSKESIKSASNVTRWPSSYRFLKICIWRLAFKHIPESPRKLFQREQTLGLAKELAVS